MRCHIGWIAVRIGAYMRIYPEVELDEVQVRRVVTCGIAREVESLRSNRKDNHGAPKDPFQGMLWHIDGAGGEMAGGEVMDLAFTGRINTFKAADLSDNVQTRTRPKHSYGDEPAQIMIRKDDNPEHLYIMLVGAVEYVKPPMLRDLDSFYRVRPSLFQAIGFIRGRDAMRKEWWGRPNNDREFAWWVSPQYLRPMCEFNQAAQEWCARQLARELAQEEALYRGLGLVV